MTDDLGRRIQVSYEIKRVVSLAPDLTEDVFAVGAGDRLVGVTTFCDYPESARSIPKVGDTLNPNLETIVALKPDLVLISAASQLEAFEKTLEHNGIAVYVVSPKNLPDIFLALKRLAELFNTQDKAAPVISDLESRYVTFMNPGPLRVLPRVFVQISREPLFSIGKESFMTEVVLLAGGESVTEKIATAYPKVSKETALAMNPDVIVLSDSEDNKEPNDVFKNSPAVKNGRVYRINADILSRPGPRIFDALEELAHDLCPAKSPIHSGC